MHFRWPALDETQGSGSVEVLECSGADERAQSGRTVHGAWGDSFMVEAVSREKGGGSTVQGGSKDRGVGGAGAKHGGVAPDGRHDEGMVETVVGRVNRRDRRKGGGLTQFAGWWGGCYGPATGRLLWARPNRNSVISYLTDFSN
jgi:hypothetical protein